MHQTYQNDRDAIESLFAKLSAVERQAGPRDPDADRFIRTQVEQQPGAPYFMAQTIVVQEQALAAAEARIEDLERRVAANGNQQQRGGGFLASLFGGGMQREAASGGRGAPWGAPAQSGTVTAQPGFGRQSFGQAGHPQQAYGQPGFGGARGGGFLAGAAQTAMGVAGGVLLGNAIGGLFADAPAANAETAAADTAAPEPAAADEPMDLGGMDEFEI